jgi:transcriptional regulator
MHPNNHFRKRSQKENIEFARERSFGTLAINADDGPLLSHIPFLLNEDATELELHLVRSNPIVGMLEQQVNAVMSVAGGDAYLSPDWYEINDQVPTWNYVAVHIRGKIQTLPHDEMHEVLNRLSHSMERRLSPKKPWTSDKMTQAVYDKMLRQIVPVKMKISEINGTWKLSQNKPKAVRLAAADKVLSSDMGSETEWLGELMKMADE